MASSQLAVTGLETYEELLAMDYDDRMRAFKAWRPVITFVPDLTTEQLYSAAADVSLARTERACYLAEINRRLKRLLRK